MTASRRPAALLLTAATAGAVLTGCGHSSSLPSVTLRSGSASAKSEAVSYQEKGTLKQASPALRSLQVRPGGEVTVSVSGTVAGRGWQARLDDKIVIDRTSKPTAGFRVPTGLGSRQPLVTVLAAPVGSSTRASGLWIFRLVPTG